MHKKVLAEDDDEASVSLFTPGKKALLAVLTVLAMAVGFAVSYFATDYVLGQQNAQNDTAITEDTQQ